VRRRHPRVSWLHGPKGAGPENQQGAFIAFSRSAVDAGPVAIRLAVEIRFRRHLMGPAADLLPGLYEIFPYEWDPPLAAPSDRSSDVASTYRDKSGTPAANLFEMPCWAASRP